MISLIRLGKYLTSNMDNFFKGFGCMDKCGQYNCFKTSLLCSLETIQSYVFNWQDNK